MKSTRQLNSATAAVLGFSAVLFYSVVSGDRGGEKENLI